MGPTRITTCSLGLVMVLGGGALAQFPPVEGNPIAADTVVDLLTSVFAGGPNLHLRTDGELVLSGTRGVFAGTLPPVEWVREGERGRRSLRLDAMPVSVQETADGLWSLDIVLPDRFEVGMAPGPDAVSDTDGSAVDRPPLAFAQAVWRPEVMRLSISPDQEALMGLSLRARDLVISGWSDVGWSIRDVRVDLVSENRSDGLADQHLDIEFADLEVLDPWLDWRAERTTVATSLTGLRLDAHPAWSRDLAALIGANVTDESDWQTVLARARSHVGGAGSVIDGFSIDVALHGATLRFRDTGRPAPVDHAELGVGVAGLSGAMPTVSFHASLDTGDSPTSPIPSFAPDQMPRAAAVAVTVHGLPTDHFREPAALALAALMGLPSPDGVLAAMAGDVVPTPRSALRHDTPITYEIGHFSYTAPVMDLTGSGMVTFDEQAMHGLTGDFWLKGRFEENATEALLFLLSFVEMETPLPIGLVFLMTGDYDTATRSPEDTLRSFHFAIGADGAVAINGIAVGELFSDL